MRNNSRNYEGLGRTRFSDFFARSRQGVSGTLEKVRNVNYGVYGAGTVWNIEGKYCERNQMIG